MQNMYILFFRKIFSLKISVSPDVSVSWSNDGKRGYFTDAERAFIPTEKL